VIDYADPHSILRGKKVLVFDFDGTLADTTPLHAAAFNEALSSHGLQVDYSAIAGMKTLDAVRKCLLNAGLELPRAVVEEIAARKQTIARRLIASDLQAIAGVDEFLAWARPRHRLCIATSGSRPTVTLALKKLGFDGWFDPMVCAEDVKKSKPAPDSFLQVLQSTGAARSEALVFEDSETGFQAARSAGLDCVDVTKLSWQRWLQ
jgi:HAD superfamily hydrolase (TIGR01509 family)